MMTFRINLFTLRTSLKLSQEEFGQSVGVSRGSIQAYETGRCQPSLETIKLIAEVYNIDDLYLFLFK
jgi:transcriptional regulator with XRE-family HTH domain